jgi:hypothetical protein
MIANQADARIEIFSLALRARSNGKMNTYKQLLELKNCADPMAALASLPINIADR